MTGHVALPAFAGWAGPRSPRVVILGEAWGESEEMSRQPFVGASGQLLWQMLGEAWPLVAPELHAEAADQMRYGPAWIRSRGAWLDTAGVAFTNVFALRPEGNKVESLCETKKENRAVRPEHAVQRSLYLRAEYMPELNRLREELTTAQPNLIIACGNTACWAVLQATNIGSIRGTVAQGAGAGVAPGTKCLPTYHPAAVLRQWNWRPIVVADLMKASREAGFPEIRRPQRIVRVNPGLEEIEQWMLGCQWQPPEVLSVDIETGNGQVKCVGFARSRADAMVVPFVDLQHASGCYWPTAGDELRAWNSVRQLLRLDCPKLFQNGLYDLQYLVRLGLLPTHCTEDTMLLHHSLFPELQKGLGFLGSVYTDESSWKLLNRQRAADQMTKRDE